VIGGDKRTEHLAALLLRDGHRLRSFALERAALPPEISRESCLQSCVYGADCVLLPLPAERGGRLHAPLSAEELGMPALIEALWPGQLLIGGALQEEMVTAALRGGLRVADLLRQPALAVGNAALTAEGAIGRLIEHSERALWGGRALVLGWGRIGRILALRLSALGAQVTVAARSARDRAMAQALGCAAVDYVELDAVLGDFDFIVNTVPARVLTEGMLCLIRPDALLLELASPPGGFDRTLAQNIGLHALAAPGLPGETAPEAAALLLRQAVYAAIEETED
jgi:dipicolinate synthase subunit A